MMSSPYPVPRTPYSEKGQPERSEVLQVDVRGTGIGAIQRDQAIASSRLRTIRSRYEVQASAASRDPRGVTC